MLWDRRQEALTRDDQLLVQVTQEDINRGEKGRAFGCMVARALNREVPRYGLGWGVASNAHCTNRKEHKHWLWGKSVEYAYESWEMDENTRKHITDFDLGRPVEPFVAVLTRTAATTL